MTKKRLLRTLLTVLLAVLVLRVAVFGGRGRSRGRIPPAPSAPQAPDWTAKKPGAGEGPLLLKQLPGDPPEKAAEELRARYGWPDDFELPLDVLINDAPEIPEEIRGPSPPFDEGTMR